MSLRAAVVDDTGLIINVIVVADSSFQLPPYSIIIDEFGDAEIDGTWDGENFMPKPTPQLPPEVVED